MPAQAVAIAAYEDETHVEENRRLYTAKFDLADQIIGNRFGYRRPAGGFFLWLDVSALCSDEEATVRLWRNAGVRVLPGSYAARVGADGKIPATAICASPWCSLTTPPPRRCTVSSTSSDPTGK